MSSMFVLRRQRRSATGRRAPTTERASRTPGSPGGTTACAPHPGVLSATASSVSKHSFSYVAKLAHKAETRMHALELAFRH